MLLVDVNILVYAHREEYERHAEFRDWLADLVGGQAAYGMSDVVLSGFLRLVTDSRVFHVPTQLDMALTFAANIRDRRNCVPVAPGPRHWGIFTNLCREANAKGKLIPDSYLAALAIESGSEWITNDRDFARFPGLRWRHPLDS